MSDRIFLNLKPGWALGYDKLQWMLMKRRNSRTQTGWKPVSFIACFKHILIRVLREKDITPTPKAQWYIDAMPDTFREWLRWYQFSKSKRRAA